MCFARAKKKKGVLAELRADQGQDGGVAPHMVDPQVASEPQASSQEAMAAGRKRQFSPSPPYFYLSSAPPHVFLACLHFHYPPPLPPFPITQSAILTFLSLSSEVEVRSGDEADIKAINWQPRRRRRARGEISS